MRRAASARPAWAGVARSPPRGRVPAAPRAVAGAAAAAPARRCPPRARAPRGRSRSAPAASRRRRAARAARAGDRTACAGEDRPVAARAESSVAWPARGLRAAVARPRTFEVSLRPGRQSRPQADQGPRPLRPRGARRRPRHRHASTSPRTPATRTACSTASRRRERRSRCGKGVAPDSSPTTPGSSKRFKASTRRGAPRPRPLGRHPARARRYHAEWVDGPGPRRHDGLDAQAVHPTTQITRSRKLEGMWWGDGGAYFVCSFARFATGAPPSTTGRSGSWTRSRTRSSSSCTSSTRRATRTTIPTARTTSPSPRTAALIIAEDGEGKQHLVG